MDFDLVLKSCTSTKDAVNKQLFRGLLLNDAGENTFHSDINLVRRDCTYVIIVQALLIFF